MAAGFPVRWKIRSRPLTQFLQLERLLREVASTVGRIAAVPDCNVRFGFVTTLSAYFGPPRRHCRNSVSDLEKIVHLFDILKVAWPLMCTSKPVKGVHTLM